MKRRLVALALLAGCAAQPKGPYYGDEKYLVIGVRPDAEAVALAKQLEAAGFPLVARVDGQNFSALGFSDAERRPIKVRVVTARGIELALDPKAADAFHASVSYTLLPSPFEAGADADGDGFEEVFVEEQRSTGEPPCIRAYRVRDSGFVDPIEDANYALPKPAESRAPSWRAPVFCAVDEPRARTDSP